MLVPCAALPNGVSAAIMWRRGKPSLKRSKVPQQPQDEEAFTRGWKERFEEFAQHNEDDAGIAGWSETGLRTRLRHFEHYWRGAAPAGRWVDVGCGAGTYTRVLAARGIAVVAMDYSLPTLRKAQQRLALPLVAADVTRLPLAAASMDGALCFGVLQALPHSRAAVAELVRILGAGGELWIDALNAWCVPHIGEQLWRRLRGRRPHVRYESPRRLLRLLRRAGLIECQLVWLPILPARLQRFQALLESAPVRGLLHWIPPLGALLSHSFLVRGKSPTKNAS